MTSPTELLSQLSLDDVRAERLRLERRLAVLEHVERALTILDETDRADDNGRPLDLRSTVDPPPSTEVDEEDEPQVAPEPEPSGPPPVTLRPKPEAVRLTGSNLDKLRLYLDVAGRARVDVLAVEIGAPKHAVSRLLNGRSDFVQDRDGYWSLARRPR